MKTSALSELHTIYHNIEYAPGNKDSFGHKLINHSVYLTSWEFVTVRVFFLEIYFWRGNYFCRERNVKSVLKTNEICYCLGGNSNLRGEISPPKGSEKTLVTV